jgi:DNA polymerase-1
MAKRINFGIVYGIGPKHFTEILAVEYPEAGYTYSDAFAFINGYYKTYPAVRPFMSRVQRALMERSVPGASVPTGYVYDLFGRKYPCPKEVSYRAVNYLIQGCAAGVLKKAMVEVHEYLKNKQSNLLLCIHDELVFEIHNSELNTVLPALIEIMEDNSTFRVPIRVSVEGTSTSWADKDSSFLQIDRG